MKKMLLVFCIFCAVLCFAGCGKKIDSSFEEEKLTAEAEKIAACLREEKYEEITALFSGEMKPRMSAEDLKQAWELIRDQAGEYQGFSDYKLRPYAQNGATVIWNSDFQNGKSQLTLSFNPDMELEGLFISKLH